MPVYKRTSQSSTSARIYNGISDVYSGFTDNKAKGDYSHNTKNDDGTPTYYWNYINGNYVGSQSRELWAHMFGRQMTNSKVSIQELMKYFPESAKKIEEICISIRKGNK